MASSPGLQAALHRKFNFFFVSFHVDEVCLGPKLKFYLFPLTRPTLKKSPYSKNFISIFSQEFFFLNVIANFQNCPMLTVLS